jgi:hypothetical protein
MPPAGFEPTIPASERPQTHALDRAATGIGRYTLYRGKKEINTQGLHSVIHCLKCVRSIQCMFWDF